MRLFLASALYLLSSTVVAACPALLDRKMDFGGQEPGSNREIASFCVNQYAIDFPMFAKIPVKGKQAHPFYAELAKRTGTAPRWNFHKYLVDRSGSKVQSFATRVEPNDPELVAAIERLLERRQP